MAGKGSLTGNIIDYLLLFIISYLFKDDRNKLKKRRERVSNLQWRRQISLKVKAIMKRLRKLEAEKTILPISDPKVTIFPKLLSPCSLCNAL